MACGGNVRTSVGGVFVVEMMRLIAWKIHELNASVANVVADPGGAHPPPPPISPNDFTDPTRRAPAPYFIVFSQSLAQA